MINDEKAPFRGRGCREATGVVPRRPYNYTIRPKARNLRANATHQENHLWYDFLRNYKTRFTRQRIVGNYILDFFCPKAMIAVELDGSQHLEQEAVEYDKIRTEYLNLLDIKVLRFTNVDVDENFNEVCAIIKENVNTRVGQPPPTLSAPPSAEGGFGAGNSH